MPRPVFRSFQVRAEIGLAHLWGYVKEHGTACVPRFYTCSDGYRLGSWVHGRRQVRGRDPQFDGLLEALPGWAWAPWEQAFEDKLKRVEAAIASSRLAGDRELKRWLAVQRARSRSGRLAPRRLERLREAGVL